MKQILIAIFVISLLSSCKGQSNNGKSYNSKYTVEQIPNKEGFLQLTDEEKSVDSMFSSYDKAIDSIAYQNEKTKDIISNLKRDYANNRSRIFLQDYQNGKKTEIDSAFVRGVSAPCECLLNQDTLFVTTGVGFFGGMGFKIIIAKDGFQSTTVLYMKNARPYKLHIADSFTNHLSVGSKYQSLILDRKSSFKEGQQLIGYLEMTTNKYYESTFGDKLDTNYVTGRIFFACTTKTPLKVSNGIK